LNKIPIGVLSRNGDADCDHDGLSDALEQAIGTEVCNQDTDGDGYLDGEEVASGYDPTKKAPGDELPGTVPKTPRPLPENLTEALRQQLTGQITQNKLVPLDANGQLLSAQDLQNYPAIQQSVQEITNNDGNLFAPDPIDDSQIKTISDNSQAAIQNYAAAVVTAISQVQGSATQTKQVETEMLDNALENNDFTLLDQNLQIYQGIYANIKKLTVPTDLLPLHKEQLEIISQTIKIYQGIKEINTDPLKASLALQVYDTLRQQFANWLQKLAEFTKRYQ